MPSASTPLPRDRHHYCPDNTYHRIQSLYTRLGSPPKWTKVGKACLRCQTFWPEQRPLL